MNFYTWVKRIRLDSPSENTKNFKMRVRTNLTTWLDTHEPILVPFSIHSNFHEGDLGTLKVNTLISILKSHTQGKITILLTENAHLHALSLSFNGDIQKALQKCIIDSQSLKERFESIFQGCEVVSMDQMITADPDYQNFHDKLMHIYQIDKHFQELLRADALCSYTPARAEEVPDKELFISKSIEDLLEQIIIVFVAIKLGYRFECYPGKPNSSSEYINRNFFPKDKQLSRVIVCITKRA